MAAAGLGRVKPGYGFFPVPVPVYRRPAAPGEAEGLLPAGGKEQRRRTGQDSLRQTGKVNRETSQAHVINYYYVYYKISLWGGFMDCNSHLQVILGFVVQQSNFPNFRSMKHTGVVRLKGSCNCNYN